jgi:peptide/nickel transport system ATP-binding protein
VGESGSGKSVTSLTLMRLLPKTAHAQVRRHRIVRARDGQALDLLRMANARCARCAATSWR